MSSFDGSRDLDRSAGFDDADRPVLAVHACSRIGMTANPPQAFFSGWFRRRVTQ